MLWAYRVKNMNAYGQRLTDKSFVSLFYVCEWLSSKIYFNKIFLEWFTLNELIEVLPFM